MHADKIKGKIMYIEDEVDSLRTMIEFLNPRGFAVIVACTAEEGYRHMKLYKPDLILIDLKLLGQSGIDFIKRVRHEGIDTPVIVITAYPKKVADVELRQLKIHGYYVKPFSYSDLYETIKQILEVS